RLDVFFGSTTVPESNSVSPVADSTSWATINHEPVRDNGSDYIFT
ncbi:MAG: hypothetical protein ACI8UP_002376, partial [Porticoccaceae bacterium]